MDKLFWENIPFSSGLTVSGIQLGGKEVDVIPLFVDIGCVGFIAFCCVPSQFADFFPFPDLKPYFACYPCTECQ